MTAAFVEQKNCAVVRRLVCYQRLEAPALATLECVHELARDYVNFMHPVRKLTEKIRPRARITRRHDAAQTPYRRLLAGGVLPSKTGREFDRSLGSGPSTPAQIGARIRSAQPRPARRAPRHPSPRSV